MAGYPLRVINRRLRLSISIWREQALHEAGHVTAALALHQDVLSVEIRHGGGGLTRTRAPRYSDRQAVLDFVVVAFAGIVASEQIGSREGCAGDRANIRNKLATIAHPRERAAIEAEARRMAERIVDSRWLDVSRIGNVPAAHGRRCAGAACPIAPGGLKSWPPGMVTRVFEDRLPDPRSCPSPCGAADCRVAQCPLTDTNSCL
jgi:hypothetical protein